MGKYSKLDYAYIFSNVWNGIAEPERFSNVYNLYYPLHGQKNDVLVQEKYAGDSNTVWLTWVSEESLSVSYLKEAFVSKTIMLIALDSVQFIDKPDGYGIEIAEKGHLYIRDANSEQPPYLDDSEVVRLGREHLPLFDNWEKDDATQSYISQYRRIILDADIADDINHVYGLILGGNLVSCAVLSYYSFPALGLRVAHIGDTFTRSNLRGKSYSKRVVSAVIRRADCPNISYAVDTVDLEENLPSKAVAVACGFRAYACTYLSRIMFKG